MDIRMNGHAIIDTFSGRRIDLQQPLAGDIHIVDIATALSRLCRFNGHCREFYSVAEHSVLVSQILEQDHPKKHPELSLWGLLHDAAEAYIGDITTPMKKALGVTRPIEGVILRAIADCLDLSWPFPDEIHEADAIALAAEGRDFMGWDQNRIAEIAKAEPLECALPSPMPPDLAKNYFLRRFNHLVTGSPAWTRKEAA